MAQLSSHSTAYTVFHPHSRAIHFPFPCRWFHRGFLNAAGELRVTDYPYAEDGLLIWNALTKYFTKYIDMYYTDDEAVKDDTWLQGW